jgi:hypothetical protein
MAPTRARLSALVGTLTPMLSLAVVVLADELGRRW